MGDNATFEGKFASAETITRLWQRTAQTFVRKDGDKVLSDNNFTDADKNKLGDLENYVLPNASDETLGGIKIGTGLAVDAQGVVTVESAGSVEWEDVQNAPTTLAGFGITDAATKTELEAVRQTASKAYHFKGSVQTYDVLEEIVNPLEGDVYNVIETGKNYAWSIENNEGSWDDLGGIFEIESISTHDIDVITGYASSEAILDEILANGGYVEIGNNITLTTQKFITKNTVINLNGYQLTGAVPANEKKAVFMVDGATLTFKGTGEVTSLYDIGMAYNGGEIVIDGGVFTADSGGFTVVGENSGIVVNAGQIDSVEGAVGAFDGASVEINGGSLYASDNFSVFTNGVEGRGNNSIVINDGTIESSISSMGYISCGIYIANNDTLVVNGGHILSNDGCGILMRSGTVTINDGNINAYADTHVPGWVGSKNVPISASAIVYNQSTHFPGYESMSLTINGGTISGDDNAIEVISDVEPNITINGGTLIPPLN